MRIGNISNQTSFGKVYAVAGKPEQIKELKENIKYTDGNVLALDATDIYKIMPSKGKCSKAVKDGKDVAFFITGKDDTQKVDYMFDGWGSIFGISKHIDKFINLRSTKAATEEIRTSIAKDE